MKTIDSNFKSGNKLSFLSKCALPFITLLFIILPKTGFGQPPACNYLVHNSNACTITVTVTYYDNCVNNTTCSGSTKAIAPNTSESFNCSPGCNPSNICNVRVTLDYIGTSPFLGGFVDVNNFTFNQSISPTDCSGNGGAGSVDLNFGWSSTAISVGP